MPREPGTALHGQQDVLPSGIQPCNGTGTNLNQPRFQRYTTATQQTYSSASNSARRKAATDAPADITASRLPSNARLLITAHLLPSNIPLLITANFTLIKC